jgi:hypothetical protein
MRGRNWGPFDRNPLAMLLGAIIVVVGVLTAIFVVGLGGVFHFLFSFLLPMALILLVVNSLRPSMYCSKSKLASWMGRMLVM